MRILKTLKFSSSKVDGFFIREYILKLHDREFVDFDRIGDLYELREVPLSSLEEEWETYQETIDEYSRMDYNSMPPIVIDMYGSIVDGSHRMEAAKKAGRTSILAYVQIK